MTQRNLRIAAVPIAALMLVTCLVGQAQEREKPAKRIAICEVYKCAKAIG